MAGAPQFKKIKSEQNCCCSKQSTAMQKAFARARASDFFGGCRTA